MYLLKNRDETEISRKYFASGGHLKSYNAVFNKLKDANEILSKLNEKLLNENDRLKKELSITKKPL